MELKEFDILLDIMRSSKNEYFEVVQGDLDTNALNIALQKNFVPYPLTGLTVEIAFSKSDGTTVIQDINNGVTVADATNGKIRCVLKTNTIAAVGRVRAEVRVSEADKLLTSTSFEFFVKKAIFGDDTFLSTNEWPLYQQLLVAAQSEDERVQNEALRISEEIKRVTSESQRVTRFYEMETAYKAAMNFSASQANLEMLDARLGRATLGALNREIINELDSSKLSTLTTDAAVTTLNGVQDGIMTVDKIEGNTLKNEISNGNFSKGKEGWFYSNGTWNVSNNTAVITGNGSVSNSNIFQDTNIDCVAGKKFYIKVIARVTNSDCTRILIDLYGSTATGTIQSILVANPVINQFYNIAGVVTLPSDATGKVRLVVRQVYPDSATANGKIIEITNVMLFDLTAMFGAGKEPTKEWMDARINQYFEAIKHVDSCVIKSVGKNQFNIANNYMIGTSKFDKITATGFEHNFVDRPITMGVNLDLAKDTDHRLSFDSNLTGSQVLVVIFYGERNAKVGSNVELLRVDMTSSIKERTVRFSKSVKSLVFARANSTTASSNLIVSNIQIEPGTVKTAFEVYKEDKLDLTQYINTDEKALKKLPNGVADTIANDGTLTRRVGKVVLKGTESLSLHQTGVNCIIFGLDTFSNIAKAGAVSVSTPIPYASINTIYANDVEGVAINPTGGLRVGISKSKLPGYNDALTNTEKIALVKTWLATNNITVYYELAVQTVETIQGLTTLKCSKNGSLIVESPIPNNITIKYPTNLLSRVQTVEENLDRAFDSLGGAWKTILMLGDRELKMKSISLLTTETTLDIKNKVNEILNAWR